MKYTIVTTTCYRRREETALARSFLERNGWLESRQTQDADLVVFFACSGLRHLTEEKIEQIRETSRQMKAGAELVVGGCLPGMDTQRLREAFPGRIITPTDFAALDALAGLKVRMEEMEKPWGPGSVCRKIERPPLATRLRMRVDHRVLQGLRLVAGRGPVWPPAVRLQRKITTGFSVVAGCARRCTYCARPSASGPVRSKPIESIIQNIREGLRCGFRGFDLYADSIGAYGSDLGVNLVTLLDRIREVRERFTIGLFDLHPQDFLRAFESVRRLCEQGKLHYLHVPIQSGNGRVLRAMRRECDLEDLAAKLILIRHTGRVFMQSGIIAGFPGETVQEFEDTLAFLRRVDFDDVYVHQYCDMPGTEASTMTGKASEADMLRRLELVRAAGFRYNAEATEREWARNTALPVFTPVKAVRLA